VELAVIGVPPRSLTGLGSPTAVLRDGEVPAERLEPPHDPAVPAPRRTTAGESATTGERIARRFFELCENPRTRERVMRTLRSSANSAVGGRLLVALLSRTVLTPLLRSRRVDATAAKIELVAAQLGGIAVLRYVTRMEPIASMPVDDLVALVGPTLQATLDAPSRG
jgi:hypothetical protein